jgi:hypothetical protein
VKKSVLVVAGLVAAGTAACSSSNGKETAALRAQVNALQQQLLTTTTTAAPTSTTTTTEAPTTTTTVRQPQGTVEWSFVKTDFYGPPCATTTYQINNRSDTPVLKVTIKGARLDRQNPNANTQNNLPAFLEDGPIFPAQTQAAGIPAWGQGNITFNWCNKNWPKDPEMAHVFTDPDYYLTYMQIDPSSGTMTWEWAS